MKVSILTATNNPVETLIFAKNTRLNMRASNMKKLEEMSDQEKMEHLEYIANTIKSSWEFFDITFMIEDVDRGFTHQFVRNRQGSYAQQTMRILDKSNFDYTIGPTIENNPQALELYCDTMATINGAYQELIDMGVAIEDARGVLPTNITTNICVKYNLRTLSELMASRSSPRTQAMFRSVLDEMYERVVEVYPWCAMFLRDKKYDAAKVLDSWIKSDYEGTDNFTHLIKQVDILRK